MNRDSLVTGLSVLGVILGLLVLLVGEATHVDGMVYGGGVVVLVAVGVLTVFVAGLPEPDHGS